jgi:cardiolipin synthase (CMP-forming)
MAPPRWLPNAISIGRVLLVPVWLALAELTAERPGLLPVLAGVLLALGLSDLVDGYLARRYSLVTRLGATLDAIADKLAQLSFVTYLAWWAIPPLDRLPIWFWAIVVARDLALLIGYAVLKRRRGTVDTEHLGHGKLASVLLFVIVLGAITPLVEPNMTLGACWLTAPVIALSTLDYLRRGLMQLSPPRERPHK